MLVGCKRIDDGKGNSYIDFDVQGTPDELERLYNKEPVEIEIDKEDRYKSSVEEDYKAFLEEVNAEIDDLDADDLFGSDED